MVPDDLCDETATSFDGYVNNRDPRYSGIATAQVKPGPMTEPSGLFMQPPVCMWMLKSSKSPPLLAKQVYPGGPAVSVTVAALRSCSLSLLGARVDAHFSAKEHDTLLASTL